MAWSTPRTWAVGELVTAANMNTYISDNLAYLYSAIAAQIELFGTALTPSATSGATGLTRVETATNKNYIGGMQFVNGSQTYAEATLPMLPDDYNGGTMLAEFIWMANSSSGNSVIWGLQGRSLGDSEATDQAQGTAQEVTDANNSAIYDVNISDPSAAITLAGTPSAGELAHFRVYRKGSGSDNLAVPAILIGAVLTYTRS